MGRDIHVENKYVSLIFKPVISNSLNYMNWRCFGWPFWPGSGLSLLVLQLWMIHREDFPITEFHRDMQETLVGNMNIFI